MIFARPLHGQQGKLARFFVRAGVALVLCSLADLAVVYVLVLVTDFVIGQVYIWAILIGFTALLAGACLWGLPYFLLSLPVKPPSDPLCPQCGYNLTGLTEPRCPECGQPFDLTQ